MLVYNFVLNLLGKYSLFYDKANLKCRKNHLTENYEYNKYKSLGTITQKIKRRLRNSAERRHPAVWRLAAKGALSTQ